MPRYYVEAPIVGKMVGEVEASSEKEALEKFFRIPWQMQLEIEDPEEGCWAEVEELNIRKPVNPGNVCYSPIGEATAELAEEFN